MRGLGRRVLPRLSVVTLALGLSACATLAPPTIPPGPASDDPSAAWERVLRTHVLDDGRIDFEGVRSDPRDLAAYVTWLSGHGPRTTPALFPTEAARLAYYVNGYNALAMYQVVTTDRRPEQQIRFFFLTAVAIDGERISLYRLENAVIRSFSEPRVHFALNCMVRGCPRLPREAFDPVRLDPQLDHEARRFLNEPRNVQVDPPLRVVRLNSILRFWRSDFLARAPSLVAYANRYRDEPIPEDYAIRFIPYDWTLQQR
jgi:Protein of unknown function, DUF547